METTKYSCDLGRYLIIWITGDVETYIAEVIKEDPLWLKVKEEGPYAKLKPGDYIIKQYYSSLFQKSQEDIDRLLREAVERKHPFLSGLKSLGVNDGNMHEILPRDAD